MVLFTCAQGADADALAASDLLVLPLICTGQLPPSFVEYALRDGAAGVIVASCRDGGCAYRLGARWTAERLTGQREPHLRPAMAAALRRVEADAGETPALQASVQAMRQNLNQFKAPPGPTPKMPHG
jgi:coenzyme F420-reducing hydrogenase delta subunit